MSSITANVHTRLAWALLGVLGIGLIGTVCYNLSTFATGAFLINSGFGLFLTAFLLATAGNYIPWAAERTSNLAAAGLWGGGFAILGAIAIERGIFAFINANVMPIDAVFNVTVIAPVVEELIKLVGVLVLLAANRGRANPFLLALVVGLGFGTVENIQYFASAFTQYGFSQSYFALMLGRGLVGPLLHAMCVGYVGLAIIWARQHRRVLLIPAVSLALGIGMVLHSVCNGAFGLVTSNYIESAVVVAFTVLLVMAFRRVSGIKRGDKAPVA